MNHVLLSDPGDRRWVGMWWGGFLLCGFLLVMVAIPFYAFPKTLQVRKNNIFLIE
jgi:organic anion transporter 3A